jgi:hypothetical protein
MKYATAVLTAALLCSGAAFAQSMSGIGQYHKDRSNMQAASDTKTKANATTTTDAKAQVDANGCQISGGGREMTGSNAANTPDMNSQVGRQDTTTQTANNAAAGGTKCDGKYPAVAPAVTDPGPK